MKCHETKYPLHPFIYFITLGTSLGTVISIPTSGVIAGALGWEAVFYIHGGLSIIWCFLWAFFVTDDTQKHPFMSVEEKKFIEDNHAKAKKDPQREAGRCGSCGASIGRKSSCDYCGASQ